MARKKDGGFTVIDGGNGGGSGSGGGKQSDDWRLKLTRNQRGALNANHHNLQMIFEHDDALRGIFKLDEFSNRVALDRAPPWKGSNADEFTELDGVEISAWLGQPSAHGGYEISAKSSLVIEVVEAVARRHKYHPVRDYLRGLQWDGKERIPMLFVKHCDCPDDDYHRRVAVMFMLGAAARILRPGCKVDTMLVLEGRQGLGKTTVTQALFGGDRWYMDAQRSPAEKDFYQDIVGKWGVEIGEMTSFTKAEANKVKQTLSATADTYRPSYGRYSRTFPRQCVFIGTTNETQWQRDHTGGRRFLPVCVLRVDVEAIKSRRDQLWAEAVERLDRGEDWWTMPEGSEIEQDARYMEDVWAQDVLEWVSGLMPLQRYEGLRFSKRKPGLGEMIVVSTSDVLTHALKVDVGKISYSDQQRVAKILTHWGWTQSRPRINGAQVRVWHPPEGFKYLQSADGAKGVDDGPTNFDD